MSVTKMQDVLEGMGEPLCLLDSYIMFQSVLIRLIAARSVQHRPARSNLFFCYLGARALRPATNQKQIVDQ